ncbi:MAG: glycosyltransferase [Desulfobacterales bacterium]
MTIEESKIDPVPLISVLMPCYNHEEYVLSSLESVAASDYKFIEFIFIDDASKDNSFNLAKKWFKKNKDRFARTMCIQHEKNRGICATFNELYTLSHGEYISYLASDDLLLVNAISKQTRFALNNGVDFVFSDCMLIDESEKLISDSGLQYFGKNAQMLDNRVCLAAEIIFFWGVPWYKFFMKSALVKKIGLFDENLCFEDRDFIIRVLINGSFKFMPNVTTAYRIRFKNRITPGLVREDIINDFRKADCKNYLNSKGVIRFLLGIVVYCYEERYRELEIKNFAFISHFSRILRLLMRSIIKFHRLVHHFFRRVWN